MALLIAHHLKFSCSGIIIMLWNTIVYSSGRHLDMSMVSMRSERLDSIILYPSPEFTV
jgi:hypothetical protein